MCTNSSPASEVSSYGRKVLMQLLVLMTQDRALRLRFVCRHLSSYCWLKLLANDWPSPIISPQDLLRVFSSLISSRIAYSVSAAYRVIAVGQCAASRVKNWADSVLLSGGYLSMRRFRHLSLKNIAGKCMSINLARSASLLTPYTLKVIQSLTPRYCFWQQHRVRFLQRSSLREEVKVCY